MVYESKDMEMRAALATAARMCAAARTAPKGHGMDTLRTLVLTGDDLERLAQAMESLGTRLMGSKMPTWYGRDANNVRASLAVVLIGAEKKYRGVPNCGYCGFSDCAACQAAGGNCAVAYIDLGIAACSAADTAAMDKVDNRIMISIGRAAAEMDFGADCLWLGIPLSVSGKSIFYDRGIFHD